MCNERVSVALHESQTRVSAKSSTLSSVFFGFSLFIPIVCRHWVFICCRYAEADTKWIQLTLTVVRHDVAWSILFYMRFYIVCCYSFSSFLSRWDWLFFRLHSHWFVFVFTIKSREWINTKWHFGVALNFNPLWNLWNEEKRRRKKKKKCNRAQTFGNNRKEFHILWWWIYTDKGIVNFASK